MKRATVFAPATVANVAVGFDILGFAIEGIGDLVTVEKQETSSSLPSPPLELTAIQGTVPGLPVDPLQNTATVGLRKMIDELKLNFGFKVTLRKAIPMGSGMGGSAASSVAAVVAANSLLDHPLQPHELLDFALAGEVAASGAAHPDNIVPCLYGGMTLIRSAPPLQVVPIPVPQSILCILVHPHAVLETKKSRSILKSMIPLKDHVNQSANLATFISGCFTNNLDLIKTSMTDLLIEPQRAPLIEGFQQAKDAALKEGALGCSISGSGPSLFAWASDLSVAERIRNAIKAEFDKLKMDSDTWISGVSLQGARIVS